MLISASKWGMQHRHLQLLIHQLICLHLQHLLICLHLQHLQHLHHLINIDGVAYLGRGPYISIKHQQQQAHHQQQQHQQQEHQDQQQPFFSLALIAGLAPLIVFSKSLRGLPLLLYFINHCGACPSYCKQFNLGLTPRNLCSNS